MRWEEVTYLLHDWWVTVLFDTPHDPHKVQQYYGKVYCPTAGAVPLLKNGRDDRVMYPPRWALTLVHTASAPTNPW